MSCVAAHFILYISDQEHSTRFYTDVLNIKPRLNVPGMTEFVLMDGAILGLMPENGIVKLLGKTIQHPNVANGIARSELYLLVKDPQQYFRRALLGGAKELSPFKKRSWGHSVAYCSDLDGHILAFASTEL